VIGDIYIAHCDNCVITENWWFFRRNI